MSMRVGTICFATERGLGYLAKSFYDNGIVSEGCVAMVHHGRIPTHPEWYPDCIEIAGRPFLNNAVKAMIKTVDVMLYFETPVDWQAIDYARSVGVKSVLITMYECTPEVTPYVPDQYLCPSLLDMEYFPDNSVFLPIPIDPNVTPWGPRTTARTFVHNSGYIGLRGRSGTQEVVDSVKYIKSNAKLIIRSQDVKLQRMVDGAEGIKDNPNVEIYTGILPYEQLRVGCDVCLAPEKFNGLSLPLQESFASGMLVMTTDRFPANTWLPSDPLILPIGTQRGRVARRMLEFDESTVDPIDIAQKIDEWYGRDITGFSLEGKRWAEENSWERLRPRYLEALAK